MDIAGLFPRSNDGIYRKKSLTGRFFRPADQDEEDIEFAAVGNEEQKFSVFDARPAGTRNSLDFVAWQIPPQTRGQTFS
jgi:hypothetical protein